MTRVPEIARLLPMPAPAAKPADGDQLPPHQAPGSNNRGERYLPPTFTRRVRRFLLKHMLKDRRRVRAPRYFVIDGGSGIGKTQGVLIAISEAGWGLIRVSAGELAGETEGAANQTLRAKLAAAELISRLRGYPVLLLIDDFDLSIVGGDPRLERTVNTNLLTTDLQWLADETTSYVTCRGLPVPIIFTGNDMRMRSSLFRDGRADWFTYEPTLDEKVGIVLPVFAPETPAERSAVEALVRSYRNEPVSFFVGVASDIEAQRFDHIADDDLADLVSIEAELNRLESIDPALLKTVAKARASRDVRSHL